MDLPQVLIDTSAPEMPAEGEEDHRTCCGRSFDSGKALSMHRIRRHRPPPAPRDLIERLMEKVDKSDPSGCWLWTGALSGPGYGVLGRGRRDEGNVMAHRALFEHVRGPIAEGLVLDHMCRVRRCVNPSHLEPVTNQENVSRGYELISPRVTRTCASCHRVLHVRASKAARAERSYCSAECRRSQQEQAMCHGGEA